MTTRSWNLHRKSAEHFRQVDTDYGTYANAVKTLNDKASQELKIQVIAEMKLKKKYKTKEIQKFAIKIAARIAWIPESFKASRTWCCHLRNCVQPPKRKQNRGREFQIWREWLEKSLENGARIKASDIREKYTEVVGVGKKYKAWESFAKRIRNKLQIKVEVENHKVAYWKK